MEYVAEARYVADYRIWLRMSSGRAGVVDFAETVRSVPAAAPMRDLEEFRRFYLDGWPTLAWPCGYDVAPEVLAARVERAAEGAGEAS